VPPARLDTLGHRGAGRDVSAVADLHGCHEHRVAADERVCTDIGVVLGDAVVVGKDRPRADVRALTHISVTHIAQVGDLGVVADHGVLDLDETARLRAAAETRARAQEGVRADRGVRSDHRGVRRRVADLRSGADLSVDQLCVGADLGPGRHSRRAAQQGVGLEDGVGLERDVDVDPGRLGVANRHPFAHPTLDRAPVELAMQRRELDAVIDALGLPRVVDRQPTNRRAVGAGYADDVGEIALALRVAVGEPGQCRAQRGRVESVDAGVDLADLQLHLVGVLLLDHRSDGAARVAHDAPVPGGHVEVGGEDRDGVAGALVLGNQGSKRVSGEQRGVAVGHHEGPGEPGQVAQSALHRVTRAALLVLHDGCRLGCDLGQVRLDLVTPVTDDHDQVLWLEGGRGNHRVMDQAATADGVQHLGDRRLHPGALACGEDDHGGRSGGAHARKRSSARRSGAWFRLPARGGATTIAEGGEPRRRYLAAITMRYSPPTAPGRGFEPRLVGPKPTVLPLDDPGWATPG
jgi:hypothetical protein